MELPKLGKVWKMAGFALLFLAASLIGTGFRLHPIHNSMANLAYNSQTGSLEISMRVFVDDLEAAIRPHGHEPLNIGLENEHPATADLLTKYLGRTFSVYADTTSLEILYLGKEQKEEVTWLYLEVPLMGNPGRLRVRYAVLMDRFEDQLNVLRYQQNDAAKGLLFTSNEPEQWLDIQDVD